MFITSPDKFAAEFNQLVPGAYRSITTHDIRDMVECGLIGHYHYYGRQDIETVRGILHYEQLREERNQEACIKNIPKICKRCGKPLKLLSDSKRGRPNEYCPDCELYRNRDRYIDWKVKHTSEISV